MTSKTKPQNWDEGVSIIIPTFKRPDGIKIALSSVMNTPIKGRVCEIVVTDNDPAASAKETVMEMARSSDIEVRYVHVPEPGVSNARNGAMAAARGRYIAFLDDDMEALGNWAAELIAVSKKYKAGICFGPAVASMPNPQDPLNVHMKDFFSRVHDGPEGIIDDPLGTGGCLLDLQLCNMPNPPFNPDLNEVGGEDDFLFEHLISHGARIGWAPKAKSWEHVPANRATGAYLWKRNFAFGQGPTQGEADKGWKGSLGIAKWMIVGALQTVVFAPVYKVLELLNRPAHVIYLAKTAQGLGKIFWWDGFSPRLYGHAGQTHKEA